MYKYQRLLFVYQDSIILNEKLVEKYWSLVELWWSCSRIYKHGVSQNRALRTESSLTRFLVVNIKNFK